jgi:hypothetical protein
MIVAEKLTSDDAGARPWHDAQANHFDVTLLEYRWSETTDLPIIIAMMQ